MGKAEDSDARGAPTEIFAELTIEQRVLVTSRRTISIPNIASISVGRLCSKRSSPLLYSSLASGVVAMNALSGAGLTNPGAIMVAFGGAALALVLLIVWLLSGDVSKPFLIVTTNDGTRSLFGGQSYATLDKVRRVLSDKMNAHDEAATYTINFDKGTIESLTLADGASLNADTMEQGSGNQVVANSAGGRLATAGQTFGASNSPGAEIGYGNVQSGSTLAVTHVDYSHVLPQIEQMHRYYARDPNAAHVAERLSEMEVLMRSGTPTEHGRSRVHALAADLSTILQGYPPLVQFFEGIMRLVGR